MSVPLRADPDDPDDPHDAHGLTMWEGVPASDMSRELFIRWDYGESAKEFLSPSVRYRWSTFPTGYTYVPIESGDGSEDSFIIVPSNFFADYSASTGDSAGMYILSALGASGPIVFSNYTFTSFANMPRGPMFNQPLIPSKGPVTVAWIYQKQMAGQVYSGRGVSLKRIGPSHHKAAFVVSKGGKLTVQKVTGKISPKMAGEVTAGQYVNRAAGVHEARTIRKSSKFGKPLNVGKVGTTKNLKAWKKAYKTKLHKPMEVDLNGRTPRVKPPLRLSPARRFLGGGVRFAGNAMVLVQAFEHARQQRIAAKGYVEAPYTLSDARGSYKLREDTYIWKPWKDRVYYKVYVGGPYHGTLKRLELQHGREIRDLMHKKFGYKNIFGDFVPGTERKTLPHIPLNPDGSVVPMS